MKEQFPQSLGQTLCSLCGSVVEHCVRSAKGCGFNSQGTQILLKNLQPECNCKSLWIKASAKCINVNVNTTQSGSERHAASSLPALSSSFATGQEVLLRAEVLNLLELKPPQASPTMWHAPPFPPLPPIF